MTEEEAKTKWCPQAHAGEDQPCIDSKCMAWRTLTPARDNEGYCGLAGKP